MAASAVASSEASDLGNGSGTHFERQVGRQIQVYGDLPLLLPLPLATPLAADAAAWSVHTLKVLMFYMYIKEQIRYRKPCNVPRYLQDADTSANLA